MAYNICKYGDGSGGGGDTRPDGSTVTPVSDVSIWLRCGGLGSKGYTTLSQVLADADTLNGLMSDANAVNYLVRSTSWISDITSNQSAMTYIGANDYAAYKLLRNSSWLTAILDSSYWKNVLTTKIPAMVNETSPEGNCFCSGTTSGIVWRPFRWGDNLPSSYDGNGQWYHNVTGAYIGYQFTQPADIYKVHLGMAGNTSYQTYTWTMKVQSSVDGVNYDDTMAPITFSADFTKQSYNALSVMSAHNTNRKYFRLYTVSGTNGSPYVYLIQMWGRTFGDVQSWLKAGGVTDKSYTTLQQVLADSSTLQALMASSDAVDYLRACGNWASTICANQSAMNYIGLNNYTANTLLNDICWCKAICGSAYFESVLNVKVPTMTSNTTPSGVVSGSGYLAGNEYWRGFDGTDTQWIPTYASYFTASDWLQYQFTSKQKIYAIGCRDNISNTLYLKLTASNDNSGFTELGACTAVNGDNVMKCHFIGVPSEKYLYYRIGFTQNSNKRCLDFQLFGRQDV